MKPVKDSQNLSQVQLAVVDFIKNQLGKDSRESDDRKLSLAGKWAPSINTSSKETRRLAHILARAMGVTPAKYRKTLSAIRSRLNVVEKMMSTGAWESINFEHVPSKANLLYRKAFSRRQPERYTAFIKDVQTGDAKINAGTIYPYEIVRDALDGDAQQPKTLDVLWKALPDYTTENPHNAIVVCDTSSSMHGMSGTIKPIWVSVSLAIYFAQRTKGAFKDYFLAFDSTSDLIKIRSKNIVDAANEVYCAHWGGSTNLQSAFDSILTAAIEGKVPQRELPDVVYVISDMEFDDACRGNETNFEVIADKYRTAGYKMPRIVFWNVDARNDQSPVRFDERGTALVSGCSPSIFKTVLSGKNVTPYQVMLDTINNERYDSVVV